MLTAVKEITENHRSVSDAMRVAGYSPHTASKPSNMTETKAFKDLMNERGLTDDFLLDALHEDIEKKPQNRLGELTLASKLKGHLREQDNSVDRMVVVLPNVLLDKLSNMSQDNNNASMSSEQNVVRDVENGSA